MGGRIYLFGQYSRFNFPNLTLAFSTTGLLPLQSIVALRLIETENSGTSFGFLFGSFSFFKLALFARISSLRCGRKHFLQPMSPSQLTWKSPVSTECWTCSSLSGALQ